MNKHIMGIRGMTCAVCAQSIEKTVRKLEGLKEAHVNLASEKLFVEYDETLLSLAAIQEAVIKIGYEITDENKYNSITIPIGGMSCAACAQHVETKIKALPGVVDVTVNLIMEKAAINYDAQQVRTSMIREAIEEAGFRVLAVNNEARQDEDKVRKQKEIRTLWRKFTIAAVFAFSLLYIAMAPMLQGILPGAAALQNLMMHYPLIYALSQLLLVIPIIGAGYKFYTIGFSALLRRSPNMDSLIALGSTAAVLFSLYNTWRIGQGDTTAVESLYFETAGMIVALILLGKSLEAVSKGRTGEAIKKLMGLTPKTAIIWQDGLEKEILLDEVEIGDVLIVKPGGKIPVDGVIITGQTTIDESMLTGESMPADKKTGDPVYAATLNTTGVIQFKAEKIGTDTALAQIVKLVEDAQGSKAPIARTADVVSGYFVPVVSLIALLAGVAWYLATKDIRFALTIFISVLVIACPCALGLATPAAIMVGTGKGAEKGILFKSGEALETAHGIDTIIFDKTGTVTTGKPSVTDIIVAEAWTKETFLQIAASAEKGSEHPLGQAIVAEAQKRGLEMLKSDHFDALAGRGITAIINNQTVLAGNRRLMNEHSIDWAAWQNDTDRLSDAGKTLMYVALDGKLAGILALADVVKDSSHSAIAKLSSMGIQVAMLTGDTLKTAEAIAKQVGIKQILAEVLPQDKANEVKKLQKQGHKVAMVGDGINDAPALAQADIGIAIGSGTDVAMESAGIVLMRSDLSDVPAAMELSHMTMRNIKQNLFWAFGYNVIGIPIAAGVLHIFGGPLLNPIFAAAAMSLSSVSVITNALRLKRYK